MPGLSALSTRPSRRRYRRRTISLTAFQGRQRRARLLHVFVTSRYRSAAFLGTIIKRARFMAAALSWSRLATAPCWGRRWDA